MKQLGLWDWVGELDDRIVELLRVSPGLTCGYRAAPEALSCRKGIYKICQGAPL